MLAHGRQVFASAAFGAESDFGCVVLSLQSQLRLAGIHPRGLSQVEPSFTSSSVRASASKAAGKFHSSQR